MTETTITTRFDAANYINNEEDAKLFLEAAEEANDPVVIADAHKIIERARAGWDQ